MPQERNSRFFVLNELKELATEADRIMHEEISQNAMDTWFLGFQEAVYKIKECNSIKEHEEFDYPSDISSIFGKNNRNRIADVPDAQRKHLHGEKHATTAEKSAVVVDHQESYKVDGKIINNNELKTDVLSDNENDKTKQKVTSAGVLNANTDTECNKSENSKLQSFASPNKDSQKNPLSHNRSASPNKGSQKNLLTPKLFTPKTKVKSVLCNNTLNSNYHSSVQLKETPVMNRTFNKILDKTQVLDSGFSDTNTMQNLKVVNIINSNSPVKTRLSVKRKSSSNNTSNKKQKLDGTHSQLPTSKNKLIHSKPPVVPSVKIPITVSGTNSKCAVIMPTLNLKPVPVPKEKQILEEIKKKEEKANENRKRVLAERQLKAEENKKKREEKREKTLQKRIKLEKEKEERLENQLKNGKEQVKKTPAMNTRVKELIEQNAKEKKSSPLSTKQDSNSTKELVKTPCNKMSINSDNYDMTPIPDSSTYDIETDDENKPSHKPIPLWAQGVQLKSALIQQFYYPPDTDELFGSHIDMPDLAQIFCIQKKRYKQRTSSAVWTSPPGSSLQH